MHRGSNTIAKILMPSVFLLSVSMFSLPTSAEVRHVPADHPTIQSCIDAANDGDECIVAPGTYHEAINFLGKAITVRSSSGMDATLIDGAMGAIDTVHCWNHEQSDTVLSGFTIKGGRGMFNIESSPTVADCMFVNNTYAAIHNGINSNPLITNCVFTRNYSILGVIYNESSSPIIRNCTFINNTIRGRVGTIYNTSTNLWGDSRPIITNCTFVGNSNVAGSGAAVYNWGGLNVTSSPIIKNCVFWNNGTDPIIDFIYANTTISYSNIEGGWPGEGNIDVDPKFVRNPMDSSDGWEDNLNSLEIDVGASGDFSDLRLKPGSPCIDAGNNEAVPDDITTDLDGLPRFVNDLAIEPDPGFGAQPVVDMGAYEYQADCNDNQIPDDIDIATGQSDDCNENGYPDQCEKKIHSDNDGLIDECDTCPESNSDITIIINSCDTNVTNTMFDDGCNMADVIAECQSGIRLRDKGKNVSCTVELATNWLRSRLITGREFSQIIRCNAKTFNPRRNALKNIRPQNP